MTDEIKTTEEIVDAPDAFKIVHGYNPGDEPKETEGIVVIRNEDGSTAQYTKEDARERLAELKALQAKFGGKEK